MSSTLDRVDWNAELIRGDLEKTVRQLEQEVLLLAVTGTPPC